MKTLFFLLLLISFVAHASTGIVKLEGTVSQGMAEYLKRCIRETKEKKYTALVVFINSPGGSLTAAEEMSQELMKLSKDGIETIAYIDSRALSAAALIALSCKAIYMQKESSIGDAEPRETLEITNERPPEKLLTYTRNLFRTAAEFSGRDPKAAEAMADRDIKIDGITESGKLLTFTAAEAEKNHFCEGIQSDFSSFEPAQNAVLFEKNAYEHIAAFLTDPVVASILLSLGMWAMIAEFFILQGWSALIGMVLFSVFFAGKWIVGMAGWTHIVLFCIGLVLIGVEIFMVPGFGIFGISGLGCLFVSLFMAFETVAEAVSSLSMSALSSIVIFILLLKYLPNSGLWKKMVLEETVPESLEETPEISEGTETVTETSLQPIGYVLINNKKYTARALDGFIEKGTAVRVKKVKGKTVIVEAV